MTIDASASGPQDGYHLAQVNIGTPVLPLDTPEMADFTDNLAQVNDLGKKSPGFVWLLAGEQEALGSTDVAWPGDPDMLVNMSVWESVDALKDFAFSGQHRELMARRREFFKKLPDAYAVLWWIPAGTLPTVQDAHDRLEHFKEHGPSAHAFTFSRLFAPEAPEAPDAG
jgi:hypothetical protein